MPVVKTDAFILKSFKYKDTSKIVTLFTEDYGKFNAIVKGVRNFKSGKCGVFETMNYISTVVYLKENRELQIISSAEYKKSFVNILSDFEKLHTALRIIDLINKSVIEHEVNKPLFKMLIYCFERLNEIYDDDLILYLFFQKKLMKTLGISPDFESDSEFETFFGNMQFSEKKHIIRNILNRIVNFEADKNKTNVLETEKAYLEMIADNFDNYILTNTHGLTSGKSRKVFTELKQI